MGSEMRSVEGIWNLERLVSLDPARLFLLFCWWIMVEREHGKSFRIGGYHVCSLRR